MKQRILIASLLIIVSLLIGFGLWWVFFRTPIAPPVTRPPSPAPPITGLPPVAPGAPPTARVAPPIPIPAIPKVAQGGPTETTRLTEGPVKAARLAGDGLSTAFLNQTDNRFYRVGPDGKPIKLSEKQFFNVDKIHWAPDTNRAILEYPDGANILFDFTRNEQVTLPKHWNDFDFSPQSNEIIAKSIGLDVNNRWLVVAAPDGSGARAIAELGENADRVIPSWSPNNQVVAFSETGRAQGFDTSEVYLVGKNNENFKSLIVEGRDFRPKWTPDGNQILYSVYNSRNNYRPLLWITDGRVDSIGANRKSLELNTWADKCTFTDSATAYCAVPRELPEGAGFQPAIAAETPDLLYRIDVGQGTKTLIGSPADGASMTNLQVSGDGRFLYFIDNRTSELRQMQLK